MGRRGLEPPRACAHSHLKAARIPIPPSTQKLFVAVLRFASKAHSLRVWAMRLRPQSRWQDIRLWFIANVACSRSKSTNTLIVQQHRRMVVDHERSICEANRKSNGAEERTWTSTSLRPQRSERCVSTNSTTSAIISKTQHNHNQSLRCGHS